MPVPVNSDLYVQARLHGNFLNAGEVVNIFNFVLDPAAGLTLQQIGCGMWRAYETDLLAITSDLVTYDRIDIAQFGDDGLIDIEEPYLIPVGSGVGGDTADAVSPFVTYSFRYVAGGGSRRHGWKRFAGVTEATNTEGGISVAGGGLVTSLAVTLQNPFVPYTVDPGTGLADEAVAGASLTPIIVHRESNGDVLDLIFVSAVAGVVFEHLGSQNTRKYGRGS